MAENPLLPNAELRALRSWTKRAQALTSKQSRKRSEASGSSRGREALLAATLMQLLPGDTLVPEPGDLTAGVLLAPAEPAEHPPFTSLHAPSPATHLLAAAGLAAAGKRAGNDKLVLAYATAGRSNAWMEALTWAQTEELPLIVAVADPSGPDAFRHESSPTPDALTWTSLGKLSRKLHLPILSVDGEDAVAVYRVMQESVLRARSGAGPAVLWAMLSATGSLEGTHSDSATPLRRLERYLRTRKIPF